MHRWFEAWFQPSRKSGCARIPQFVVTLKLRCLFETNFTERSALFSGTNGNPTQLAVGSDGKPWFTEPTAHHIGHFSPTANTVARIVPGPEDSTAQAAPETHRFQNAREFLVWG
jgi:hypothetical protein